MFIKDGPTTYRLRFNLPNSSVIQAKQSSPILWGQHIEMLVTWTMRIYLSLLLYTLVSALTLYRAVRTPVLSCATSYHSLCNSVLVHLLCCQICVYNKTINALPPCLEPLRNHNSSRYLYIYIYIILWNFRVDLWGEIEDI